jgi:hypothetical protein
MCFPVFLKVFEAYQTIVFLVKQAVASTGEACAEGEAGHLLENRLGLVAFLQ